MTNFLESALWYHSHGFHVIPTGENKRPCNLHDYNHSWKRFQDAQTEEDVRKLFSHDSEGIAILTGVGGLEVIDLDCKYDIGDSLLNDYISAVDAMDTGVTFLDTVVSGTQNGGFHAFYRASNTEGNLKLASRGATGEEAVLKPAERVKVLIETRGTGGYVIVAPTAGYTVQHKTLADVPYLEDHQRNGFINAARSLNQYLDAESYDRKEQKQLKVSKSYQDVITPWDDYNTRTDVVQYLEVNGWKALSRQRGDRIDMRRPGKDKGVSGNYDISRQLFFCWTSSSLLPPGKAFTAYGLYTYLECNGDFSESAKNLYHLGYGSRYLTSEVDVVKNVDELWEELQKMKFDARVKPKQMDFVLKAKVGLNTYDIGAFGTICNISGLPKSMKTTMLRAMMASGLSNAVPFINMSLDLKGRKLLAIDTEQPDVFYWHNNKQMLQMAGFTDSHPLFESYRLRPFDPRKRLAAIELLLQKIENVGVLALDGILDLVEDYNDTREAANIVNILMRWTAEYNLLLLPITHLGKTTGSVLGAVGSQVERKCDAEIRNVINEDEGSITVKHKLSRTRPFEAYDFRRDEEGRPVLGVKVNVPANPYGT